LGTDAIEADDLLVALTQAQLWMTQGDHAAVMRWAEERGLTAGSDSLELEKSGDLRSHLRKYEVLVLARLLIEQETPGEALALLEPLQGRMERQTRTDLVIEIQVLWALACQAQGDLAGALTALEGALSLAEPGGFVRIFVDAGRPMARLLYEAAERGTAPAYTGTLLAAFPAETPLPPPGSPEMIEPLTGRELEVLALIAEGLSNQEIARRLVLSLSTVKWHTGNIYGKLAVKNRTQAVAKARALGVLLVS
jgi:LuxR family maltose regulon positive regulatory protein